MAQSKDSKLNAISLFSGAMGLDIGIEQAGFDIKVCVEKDKFACETIKLNIERQNRDTKLIGKDINEISTMEILSQARLKIDEVDLVFGGPPCQAFSTAGKQRSLEDFRGNVIIRFLEIVRDIRPRYFLLENVRGILSTPLAFVPEDYNSYYEDILEKKGSVMYFLTKEFEKLDYSVSFSLFNAANYGIPQKRERVLIFGHLGKKRIPLPSPTHSKTGEHTRKKWTPVKEVISNCLTNEDEIVALSNKTKKYLKLLKGGQYWKNLPEKIQKEAMGKSFYLGGGKTGFYRRLAWDEPSPTLVTSPTMPATLLAHPEELRALSVKEYSQIQQFPDEWIFAGNTIQKYKQIGNAVPVGLGYVAGKTIIDFHKGNYDSKRERKNKIPYSRYKNCSDYEFIPNFELKNAILDRRRD